MGGKYRFLVFLSMPSEGEIINSLARALFEHIQPIFFYIRKQSICVCLVCLVCFTIYRDSFFLFCSEFAINRTRVRHNGVEKKIIYLFLKTPMTCLNWGRKVDEIFLPM